MPLKCYLEKSYIGAYRTNKNLKYSSISITEPTISTRYYQDNDIIYKLFLTNSHNISIKNNDKENFNRILKHNNPEGRPPGFNDMSTLTENPSIALTCFPSNEQNTISQLSVYTVIIQCLLYP